MKAFGSHDLKNLADRTFPLLKEYILEQCSLGSNMVCSGNSWIFIKKALAVHS